MEHLFLCTILISIKIFPWMFQAWGSSSRKTLSNNKEHGPIQRFTIDVTKTFCWAVHIALFNTKETHTCWPVYHMGLSSISHVTLITMMKMGLPIYFTEYPTIMTQRAWIYWELNPIMQQKWGQLHKFRAFTFVRGVPGPVPPNYRFEKTTMYWGWIR